jgi:long-chain acyl-CoA synthetase
MNLKKEKKKCYLKIWQPLSTPLERGTPKGYAFSPESCFQCGIHLIPSQPERKSAELPSCLSYFERAAVYLYQYHGVSVYFGESIEK